MAKDVRETAAAKAIRSIIILKGNRHVATVLGHFGGSRCTVTVLHMDSTAKQSGSAAGYGYDKFVSALDGLVIDGHTLTNHCGEQIKPPKALGYFPTDYKARAGYRLSNMADYDGSGSICHSYFWRDEAEKRLGVGADWPAVKALSEQLKADANLSRGYSNCYREAGLSYLEAIGYTVITAL